MSVVSLEVGAGMSPFYRPEPSGGAGVWGAGDTGRGLWAGGAGCGGSGLLSLGPQPARESGAAQGTGRGFCSRDVGRERHPVQQRLRGLAEVSEPVTGTWGALTPAPGTPWPWTSSPHRVRVQAPGRAGGGSWRGRGGRCWVLPPGCGTSLGVAASSSLISCPRSWRWVAAESLTTCGARVPGTASGPAGSDAAVPLGRRPAPSASARTP